LGRVTTGVHSCSSLEESEAQVAGGTDCESGGGQQHRRSLQSIVIVEGSSRHVLEVVCSSREPPCTDQGKPQRSPLFLAEGPVTELGVVRSRGQTEVDTEGEETLQAARSVVLDMT